MKKVLEILVSIVLHPIAIFLMLVNAIGRDDLSTGQKLLWLLAIPAWGVGPVLYITIGGGDLW